MYKAVYVTNAEQEMYDEVIKQFPQCDFMQTFTWGSLKEKTGWVPIRLLLYKGDQVKGAASVLKKKIPFSNYSFFYIPRGPLLESYENEALLEAFLENIKEKAEQERAIFYLAPK